jgi:hypothetical protein
MISHKGLRSILSNMAYQVLRFVYVDERDDKLKAVDDHIRHLTKRFNEVNDNMLKQIYMHELDYSFDRKRRILQGLPVETRRVTKYIFENGELVDVESDREEE